MLSMSIGARADCGFLAHGAVINPAVCCLHWHVRPVVTFRAAERHCFLTRTYMCSLVTHAVCMNDLAGVVTWKWIYQ